MSPVSVAVDSNLLLLLVVGLTSRDYIVKHKRLQAFLPEDFDLLADELGAASKIVVTPNTLSETSNLIDHIGEPARSRIYQVLRSLLWAPATSEILVSSAVAAERAELPLLGLTDCALLEICAGGVPLVTVDLQLYLAALRKGFKALNFNHLRDARP